MTIAGPVGVEPQWIPPKNITEAPSGLLAYVGELPGWNGGICGSRRSATSGTQLRHPRRVQGQKFGPPLAQAQGRPQGLSSRGRGWQGTSPPQRGYPGRKEGGAAALQGL